MSSPTHRDEGCRLTAPGGEGNAAAWTAKKAASIQRSFPLLAPAKQLSSEGVSAGSEKNVDNGKSTLGFWLLLTFVHIPRRIMKCCGTTSARQGCSH